MSIILFNNLYQLIFYKFTLLNLKLAVTTYNRISYLMVKKKIVTMVVIWPHKSIKKNFYHLKFDFEYSHLNWWNFEFNRVMTCYLSYSVQHQRNSVHDIFLPIFCLLICITKIERCESPNRLVAISITLVPFNIFNINYDNSTRILDPCEFSKRFASLKTIEKKKKKENED